MMIRIALLAFLVASAAALSCFPGCRFRFCGGASTFKVPSTPHQAFTPGICDASGARVGVVGGSGEALFVASGGDVTPISEWRPVGLRQPFSPSFLKTNTLQAVSNIARYSGVGAETAQQNQGAFLKGRCFALPLRAWQLIGNDGVVEDNIFTRHDNTNDCVAIRFAL